MNDIIQLATLQQKLRMNKLLTVIMDKLEEVIPQVLDKMANGAEQSEYTPVELIVMKTILETLL